MEILRELSDEELNFIIRRLKEGLPSTVKNLNYILSAQKCKRSGIDNLSAKVLPKFYTHRNGIKDNCTIFGITEKSNHTVWYFSFDETLKEITECLENTKLINWGSELLFVTIHVEQIQPILNYSLNNKLEVIENESNFFFYLPTVDALNFKVEIPNETVLVPLNENDANICNKIWKYKNEKSELWVKSLILVHGGYALRDKSTNELLAYALINDHLAIGVLNTIEKAQRKGYAQVLVKHLAKQIAKSGLIPTVFINTKNISSIDLFEKLGFKRIGGSNWILVSQSK